MKARNKHVEREYTERTLSQGGKDGLKDTSGNYRKGRHKVGRTDEQSDKLEKHTTVKH